MFDELGVHADGRESLGCAEVGAVPPTSADGSSHEEGGAVDLDGFAVVEVTLQDEEEVVLVKESEDVVGIVDGQEGGQGGEGVFGDLAKGGSEGDVGDKDERLFAIGLTKLVREPGDLLVGDVATVGEGAVFGREEVNGVEEEEFVAFGVFEGAIGGVEAEGFHGRTARIPVGGGDSGGGQADEVVVAENGLDGKVEFFEELGEDGESRGGLVRGGGEAAVDEVASADDEVGPEGIDARGEEAEGFWNAAVRDGVDVGEEEEVEGKEAGGAGTAEECSGEARGAEGEEVATGDHVGAGRGNWVTGGNRCER